MLYTIKFEYACKEWSSLSLFKRHRVYLIDISWLGEWIFNLQKIHQKLLREPWQILKHVSLWSYCSIYWAYMSLYVKVQCMIWMMANSYSCLNVSSKMERWLCKRCHPVRPTIWLIHNCSACGASECFRTAGHPWLDGSNAWEEMLWHF